MYGFERHHQQEPKLAPTPFRGHPLNDTRKPSALKQGARNPSANVEVPELPTTTLHGQNFVAASDDFAAQQRLTLNPFQGHTSDGKPSGNSSEVSKSSHPNHDDPSNLNHYDSSRVQESSEANLDDPSKGDDSHITMRNFDLLQQKESSEVSEITTVTATLLPDDLFPRTYSQLTDDFLIRKSKYAEVICGKKVTLHTWKDKLRGIHGTFKEILQCALIKLIRTYAATRHVTLENAPTLKKMLEELCRKCPIYRNHQIDTANLSLMIWVLRVPYMHELGWLVNVEELVEQKFNFRIQPPSRGRSIFHDLLIRLCHSNTQRARELMVKFSAAVWYDIEGWGPNVLGKGVPIKIKEISIPIRTNNVNQMFDGFVLIPDEMSDDAAIISSEYHVGSTILNQLSAAKSYAEFQSISERFLSSIWAKNASHAQVCNILLSKLLIFHSPRLICDLFFILANQYSFPR